MVAISTECSISGIDYLYSQYNTKYIVFISVFYIYIYIYIYIYTHRNMKT